MCLSLWAAPHTCISHMIVININIFNILSQENQKYAFSLWTIQLFSIISPVNLPSFLKTCFLWLHPLKFNPAESVALALRNVCLTKSLICDDSLLNLRRLNSSRRQPCIFQYDALVNNMPQLSGAVLAVGLRCRSQHNQSSCLEMWMPSFQSGHPQ